MFTRIFAIAAISFLPTLANAGPAITVDQIEAHFSKGIECPEGGLCVPKKDTRKVCFGTDSQCKAENAAIAAQTDPGAFDMLITFDLGSDRLSQQAQENLAEFAKALKGDKLSKATFNIDGHTDATGSDLYNQALSNRRAASVVRFLEGLGVSRERLTATGHGESQPRSTDPFAAINRRVEATLRLR